MTGEAERYERLHEILSGALHLRGGDLEAYLASIHDDDPELAAEVGELIAAGLNDEASDLFADRSIARVRSSLERLTEDATSNWMPERIGDYDLIRQIGDGGMGVIYEARHRASRRSVAIKLLHPIRANKKRLRRFRKEAELLARLNHPGIARILETGTYDAGQGPQPFIAMELVVGLDIGAFCRENELDCAARIDLLAQVADAVQYAHEHGVVHRDLKPDNVLVGNDGRPRILDFGIARSADHGASLSTALTEKGQLLGTLPYMAPEQLSLSATGLTPQVDVYALGVLGFELLTGRLPILIKGLPISKAIEVLSFSEPTRASQYDASLKGDVETILGKALEHDVDRRYASASVFAQDLRRYLAKRPIEAHPPSSTYLFQKFAQRHKLLLIGVTATILAIFTTIVTVHYAIDATKRAHSIGRASYISGIAAANGAVEIQDYRAAATYLDRLPSAHRGWEYDFLRAQLVQHDVEWDAPPAQLMHPPVFDRDGRSMFAVLSDSTICSWDTADGRLTRIGKTAKHASSAVLHGPTLRFATVMDDQVVVGDLTNGRLTHIVSQHPRPEAKVLAWDDAGQRLLYRDGETRIWDGEASRTLAEQPFSVAAFDHAGSRVAAASEGLVVLFDSVTGERVGRHELRDHVTCLEFAPSDELLAVAGRYRTAYLLNANTLDVESRLSGHQDAVSGLEWSRDGSRLVTTSGDGTARIWNTHQGGQIAVYVTSMQSSCFPVVAPDAGHFVVAGESRRSVRRFSLRNPGVLRGHDSCVRYLAFSADGSLLASAADREAGVHVWDVNRAESRRRTGAPGAGVPGSETRISRPIARFIKTLDRLSLEPDARIAISPDGEKIALSRSDGSVELYDHPSITYPQAWRDFLVHHPEASDRPLGPTHQAVSRFLTNQSAMPTGTLRGHEGEVCCIAFHPDSTRVATGGGDTTVRIWDAQTGDELLMLRGHEQLVKFLVFSPDGSLLASAAGDGTIRFWDSKPLPERRALSRGR